MNTYLDNYLSGMNDGDERFIHLDEGDVLQLKCQNPGQFKVTFTADPDADLLPGDHEDVFFAASPDWSVGIDEAWEFDKFGVWLRGPEIFYAEDAGWSCPARRAVLAPWEGLKRYSQLTKADDVGAVVAAFLDWCGPTPGHEHDGESRQGLRVKVSSLLAHIALGGAR